METVNSYLNTATICNYCEEVITTQECPVCNQCISDAPFSIWCIDGKHYHEYCYNFKEDQDD